MNEDLEQSRLPLHIYTHRRLRDMLNRNQRRLSRSAQYITQNYNRFFNTPLTPNVFLNSINQAMIDELESRQVEPEMEGERRRLLVEMDRYRKIKAIIREVKAVLMIIKYNRLSKEKRRALNTQHLSETGITFIEDIDRTMPVYPFYFRGLRTIIPQDTSEAVRFNSVCYDNYRLLGGNKITLGGVLPETLINPVLMATGRRTVVTEVERTQGVYHGHTRDFADDYYDLDDLRPTGREREDSIRDAEERNRQLNNTPQIGHGGDDRGGTRPAPVPPAPEPPVDNTTKVDANAELQRVRNLADTIRRFEGYQELTYNDAVEVRQILQTYDERNQNNHGLVLDALGRDYDHIEEIVANLRTLLEQYDRGGVEEVVPTKRDDNEANKVLAHDVEKEAPPTPTVEELQKVNPDADIKAINDVVDLGRTIMRTRYKEDNNHLGLIEGLIAEYDEMRIKPGTAEIVRSMLRIEPKIGKKIENFRARFTAFTLRGKMAQLTLEDLNPVSDLNRLKQMINEFPDPSLVIFKHDVEAFHRMAEIVELYHAVRSDVRFNESPNMKISDEGRLTRNELAKLKRIFQTYREIYANEEIRSEFLGVKRVR